jgi:hypothetical protein
MNFTEDEKMLMKLALATYMHLELDDVNLDNFDMKELMQKNGVDISNEHNKRMVSLVEKIEAI